MDVDFATKFYNLEGELISERKKNFCKLLRSKPNLDEEELKNVAPRTYLESLLYIDMLIYFKKTTKLLEIFKEGNEIFISKILKQTWFFQEIFRDLSTKQLVNEFLPCTSFITRMKILKKLSCILDECQIDEVFDCVHERYGFHIAKKILHTCSSNKIEKLLTIYEIHLQPNQVKSIFDKNPELFVKYLEHYKQVKGSVYYNSNVYQYIATKNIGLWLHLRETNKLARYCLGRRIGKKVVALKKSDVIKNVSTYTDFIRKDVVVRKLHESFKDVYFQLFPRTKCNIQYTDDCDRLFNYYPKKRQWELFSQTFSKVFNDSILDNLLYVPTWYLKIFPSRDVRIKWAEVHYNADNGNHLLKYFDPNIAIPMIKEKINVTSDIKERTDLVMLLLENCAENEDLKSLESVLKYICYRHRNEETAFRFQLLRKIQELFTLKDLNENHWKYVNEQVTFLKIRNEFDYGSQFVFLQRYLEYLFVNGKPLTEELKQYIKEVLLENLPFHVNLENPQFEKKILMEISDTLKKDEVKYKNIQTKYKHHMKLIGDIIIYNKEYPEHFIDIRNIPHLISYVYSIFDKPIDDLIEIECSIIKEILLYNLEYPEKAVKIGNAKIMEIFATTKNNIHWLDPVLGAMVKKQNRSEFENEVLKFFWNNLLDAGYRGDDIFSWYFTNEPQSLLPYLHVILEKDLPSLNIISWCLHYQPRVLLPLFDVILEKNLGERSSYFKPTDIKLMSHLNFDAKLIEAYVNKLYNTEKVQIIEDASDTLATDDQSLTVFAYRDKVSYSVKEKIIEILSVVMSTDDFIKRITERFLPVKEKVDLLDGEILKIYKLQCKVAKSLKTLQDPVKVLPTVIKFSLGDYLQSASTSLYSIFYRSPENSLPSYVEVLSNRGVSIRKHSIFLSCELLNCDYVVNMLKIGKRDNISSEKHLFSAALKYFLKNPSEGLLSLVTSNIGSIDKNDEETLYKVVEVDIPQKYRHIYLENCWKFFEIMKEKEGIKITKYLNLLLGSLCLKEVLVLLSSEFCIHLITGYFRDSIEYLYQMNQFVISCLRYREPEQEENFKLFFEIISIFKSKQDTDEIARVFYCFHDMVEENVIDERRDVVKMKFIKLFAQGWMILFQPMEMFNEYVLLTLLLAKCEAPDPFLESYAHKVVTFMEKLISEFGPLIFYKFQKLLIRTLTSANDEDKYTLFYNLLKVNTTTFTCVLVLDLLQSYYAGKPKEIRQVYDKILEILGNVTDPIVVLYYNAHLKQLTD